MVKFYCSKISQVAENIYALELMYTEGAVPSALCKMNFLINDLGEKLTAPMYLLQIDKESFAYRLLLEFDISKEGESLLLEHYFMGVIQLSIEETFIIKQDVKRLLLIADNSSLLKNYAVIELFSRKKYDMAVLYLEDQPLPFIEQLVKTLSVNIITTTRASLSSLLSDQYIGTQLCIVGQWRFIQEIHSLAQEVGYTADEVVYFLHGKKDEKVYCVKCSFINENKFFKKILICEGCQCELEITERYSKTIDAYLGYITGGTRSSKVVN